MLTASQANQIAKSCEVYKVSKIRTKLQEIEDSIKEYAHQGLFTLVTDCDNTIIAEVCKALATLGYEVDPSCSHTTAIYISW